MFIFTAKLDKRKAVLSLAAFAVLLCVLVIVVGRFRSTGTTTLKNQQTEYLSSPDNLRTNKDIVSYLASLGWQVEDAPLESVELIIPAKLTGPYADYAELQSKQGLNLAEYCGRRATRYTYKVLNYPTGEEGIVADIIICGNSLIAGDIQNPSANGFMQGLIG